MKFLRLIAIWLCLSGMIHAFEGRASFAQGNPSQSGASQKLKSEELDQLLAPIALFPDALLAQMFMASTYPLEVVQADRWVRANSKLKPDELSAQAAKQNWDPSVQSLARTASVLAMMSERLDWTQKLGDAVLSQRSDVLASVQRLRERAYAAKQLNSNKQQKVSVKADGATKYIVIEPAVPNTVYVPYYQPAVVYGAWPYAAYPPYYYPPPAYIPGSALAAGIAFGTGVAISHALWGDCDWGRGDINVSINRGNNDITIGKWEHNAEHRRGVRYNNADVQQKFGNSRAVSNRDIPNELRGRDVKPAQPRTNQTRGRSVARPQPAAQQRPQPSQRNDISRNAFNDVEPRNQARNYSDRGRESVRSAERPGGFEGRNGGGPKGKGRR